MTWQSVSPNTPPALLKEIFSLDMREIIVVIRRRFRLIAAVALAVLMLALVFILVSTPQYVAEATLQVNLNNSKVVDIESVISGAGNDTAAVQSELDVIQSRRLLTIVTEELNLASDPELNSNLAGAGIKHTLKNWLAGYDPEEDREHQRRMVLSTVNGLAERLQVERKPLSYTIIVGFRSADPEKAAQIVNTLAEAYLQYQLQTKFEATKRANEWLEKKLSELRNKVKEAEMAVEVYQEKHGLIETAGMTVTDQQLSELNTQLILARTERAQAEARLNAALASGSGGDTALDVLKSSLIQKLREQETEVLRKRSELNNRYGPRHPKMIHVESELQEIREKIKQEIGKIISALESEAEIAKARESTLEQNLESLQGKVGGSARARVELAELVRQRDSTRRLYETFLSRSKETKQQENLGEADARILSSAEAPFNPRYPHKRLVLAIALLLGCSLGVAIAFLAEYLDNAFRSAEQMEQVLEIPSLGIAPELEGVARIIDYVLAKPSSVLAESLRSVLTNIQFSAPDNPAKVLMVTSSVPKEGKSSFAAALASMLAKSGSKVLLIDGDLKRPTLARLLGMEVEHTLEDILLGRVTEREAAITDKRSGLKLIGARAHTPNSQEILASGKMAEMIEQARKKYDMVIIDTPPVMAVADVISLSKIVDSTVFVVRWDKTPRQLVRTAVKQLLTCKVKLAGAVMTRVNLHKHAQYGYNDHGHYYGNYKEYYHS